MQCLSFLPYMIVSYTDRVYEALASHFYIIGLNSLVQDTPSSTRYVLAITCSIQKYCTSPCKLHGTNYLCCIPDVLAYSST